MGRYIIPAAIVLVGPLLWLVLGRARVARGTARPAPRGPGAPDDDEAFLRSLRVQRRQAEREQELDRRDAELKAREEELRRRRERGEEPDADDPDAPTP